MHTGMFVSESKFRSAPADFIPHIQTPNTEALAALITKPAVEAALLVRLAKKASFYGQELDSAGNPIGTDKADLKIDVDEVVKLYKDYIIPLTKDVEVRHCERYVCRGGESAGSRRSPLSAGRVPLDTTGRSVRARDRRFEEQEARINEDGLL